MTFKTQTELFNHIWETRPHVSELSGKPLLPKGHFQHHWQFCHILPKGSYPRYKFNPDNIILALPEEHQIQNEFDEFNRRYEKLRQEYYKEFYHKTF